MVTINLFQTQFTDDEWDAIERGLVLLIEQGNKGLGRHTPPRSITDDIQEAQRLHPYAETALLKIELAQ